MDEGLLAAGNRTRVWPAVALFAFANLPILAASSEAAAQLQSNAQANRALPPAVFLDCQTRRNCNVTQFRTEIDFVRWVRDRADSDVHVIFTSQDVAGGGQVYSLDFTGRGDLAGRDYQLTYTADGQAVQAETMDGLAQTLRLGLMQYAVARGMGRDFEIRFTGQLRDAAAGTADGSSAGDAEAQPGDPWNYWTFRVAMSGDLDLRETRQTSRINPRFEADRVTEDWKLDFRTWVNLRRDRRDLADGRRIRDDRNDWTVTSLIVRSIGANMAIGIDANARSSVPQNQRARFQVNPAIEWNYFPYSQAMRRQLIAHYSVGFEHSNYMEETAFGAMSETLPQHRLGIQYRAREPWGNAGVGIDANQYLHETGFYSFGLGADLSYRIVRGLELNVSGSASRVNDNIHTPAADIPDEDILLGRRSLPSSYRYETALGLSYRWGSAFANVVNTRFPRSVR